MLRLKSVRQFSIFSIGIILLSLIFPFEVSAAANYNLVGTLQDTDNPATSTNFGIGKSFNMGDINGDGHLDLLIAASVYSNSRGRLYVYYGEKIFDFVPDIIISPDDSESGSQSFPHLNEYGYGFSDLDKDGMYDIISGAFSNDKYGSDYGTGYIFFGRSNLSQLIKTNQADIFFPGDSTSKKTIGGTSNGGDFNGDGNEDIIFGTYTGTIGSAVLYYGNGTKMVDTIEDLILSVAGAIGFAGRAPLITGNFNGDDYDDIFAAEFYTHGEAYIFWGGSTMDNIYDIKLTAETTSDNMPRNAASGDIDQDGLTDLCLGAYANSTYKTKAGRVYCFFGSYLKTIVTQTTISVLESANVERGLLLNGVDINDNFGRGVYLDDLNNDGYDDLVVGAYQGDGGKDGYVQAFLSHGTSMFDSTPDFQFNHIVDARLFGNGVFAGDFNADGRSELFVTQGTSDGGVNGLSKVYAYELNHGNPTIASSQDADKNSPAINGAITNNSNNISGVQWSLTNDPGGEWFPCTADDGAFDSKSESFTCDLTSLGEGQFTIYIRGYDENGFYMPSQQYSVNNYVYPPLSPTGENTRLISLASLVGLVVLASSFKVHKKLRVGRLYRYITS